MILNMFELINPLDKIKGELDSYIDCSDERLREASRLVGLAVEQLNEYQSAKWPGETNPHWVDIDGFDPDSWR